MLRYNLLFVLSSVLLVNNLYGQEKPFGDKMFDDLEVTSSITKSYGDSVYIFKVKVLEHSVDPEYTKRYYWFYQGDVKSTVGNFAGKTLHGPFQKFDRSGALLEKGEFSGGLKHGTWLSWHRNGVISSRYSWKHGVRTNDFEEFYANGITSKKGAYKKGKLHGRVYYFTQDGSLVKKGKYRKGKLVKEKESKESRKAAAAKEASEITKSKVSKKQEAEPTNPGEKPVVEGTKVFKKKERKAKDSTEPLLNP